MEFIVGTKNFIWDYILLFGLIGLGLYLTIRLKFPQFTQLFPAIKRLFIDRGGESSQGGMTPFQSLSTAVAAQLGTGNIVGVATAIVSGGPGAVFWMLLSGFLGMSTIFSEATLAQTFREKKNGELVGGPAYYIKNGLKSKTFAYIFAAIALICMGTVGLMVQSNSIITSVNDSFGLPIWVITIGLIIIVSLILVGGMSSIAKFSEKVVPVMAGLYILGCLLIMVINYQAILPTLRNIVVGAFAPQAVFGGALGITVTQAVRFGLSRGLFSNEAGLGSTPHSHAVAEAKHPAEQGFTAMIGVLVSTFIVCIGTAMAVLTSGAYGSGVAENASVLTQNSFAVGGFGSFGAAFVSISLTLFALTTIVGWYFFAESNLKMFTGESKIAINIFKISALVFIAISAVIDPDTMWIFVDLFMGIMAIPNIVALFLLSNKTVSVLNDYNTKLKNGDRITWDYEYVNEDD